MPTFAEQIMIVFSPSYVQPLIYLPIIGFAFTQFHLENSYNIEDHQLYPVSGWMQVISTTHDAAPHAVVGLGAVSFACPTSITALAI
jgi:hypothetical protein